MNDAIILLCGVILLLAILPMVLMSRAFKGAGRKAAAGKKQSPSGGEPGAAKPETGQGQADSGSFSDSGDGKGK